MRDQLNVPVLNELNADNARSRSGSCSCRYAACARGQLQRPCRSLRKCCTLSPSIWISSAQTDILPWGFAQGDSACREMSAVMDLLMILVAALNGHVWGNRPMLQLAIAALLVSTSPDIIVAPANHPLPKKVVRIVLIGKAKYQVAISGHMAEVRRKNVLYKRDANYFVMAKQAAELASGCAVSEQVVSDAGLFVGPVIMTLVCKTVP